MKKTICLIDGSGYIFRAFYALPMMNNPSGVPVNAVYGFTNMFLKLTSRIKCDYSLVLFDETTIKSAQECFDSLPLSLNKDEDYKEISEDDISQCTGRTPYCINISEFNSIHKDFLDMSSKGEEKVNSEKNRKRKKMLFKIALILLCLGSVFAASQFDIISETFTLTLYTTVLIASIIYLIWGKFKCHMNMKVKLCLKKD